MRRARRLAYKREISEPSMANQVSLQSTGREDDRHITKEQSDDGGRLVT